MASATISTEHSTKLAVTTCSAAVRIAVPREETVDHPGLEQIALGPRWGFAGRDRMTRPFVDRNVAFQTT